MSLVLGSILIINHAYRADTNVYHFNDTMHSNLSMTISPGAIAVVHEQTLQFKFGGYIPTGSPGDTLGNL